MTTLSSILQTSSTALSVAQLGINTVSNNVANLNTAGYVREVVNQNAVSNQGLGAGVAASSIVRVANQYLQNASLSASGAAGQASAVSSTLTQAQSLFGDPTSTTSYFNQLNTVFSDLSAAAADPTSSLSSTQAVNDVSEFLSQSQSISGSLSQLSGSADGAINNDVTQVNQLLSQISTLNTDITAITSASGQASDLQNSQSQLINQLSSLVGVKVTSTAYGGVNVSTSGGAQLVSQFGAATLSYNATSSTNGQVSISQLGGSTPQIITVTGGDMGGQLSLRNSQIPGLQSQLSEFVSQTVNALNQAHNAASSVPPPAQLTGTDTGMDLATDVTGFTGKTNIAVVAANGQLQHTVAIDFSAGTVTVDGGTPASFTPTTFLSTLQTAMTSVGGTASFSNGALSLSTSTAGSGLAIQDDPTTPSAKAGRGFSQFFGLNNLVTSGQITNYNTGLTGSSANGFAAGGQIAFGINDASGNLITDVNVTVPSGGTIQGVINALNSTAGGVGGFGQFSLNSAGALSFTPSSPGSASLNVVSDNTQWTGGGGSISQLFGIGDAQRAGRTNSYAVRSDIASDPSNLALATLNLGAATTGQPVLVAGDGSGGQLLANAGGTLQSFSAAGSSGAMSTTVTDYAAGFAGSLANAATTAASASTNASAVQTEADNQRQSVEGVNLDQELVNLTTYQQAYSASARLITATQDMFSTLITMLGT